MSRRHTPGDLDRLAELANIGAGHAAGALAALVGRTIRMEVPRVHGPGEPEPLGPADEALGVFFEVEGGPGGGLVVLFPAAARPNLLERLLGVPASETAPDQAASALGEAGNILASHALSAVAHLVGDAVVPSVPHVEPDGRGRLLDAEPGVPTALRIETPLVDTAGRLQSLLVWLPAARDMSDPDDPV